MAGGVKIFVFACFESFLAAARMRLQGLEDDSFFADVRGEGASFKFALFFLHLTVLD